MQLSFSQETEIRKQTVVGTVKKNRTKVPVELPKGKGRTLYYTLEGCRDDNGLISYYPKNDKTVLFLSTILDSVTCHDREDKKANII